MKRRVVNLCTLFTLVFLALTSAVLGQTMFSNPTSIAITDSAAPPTPAATPYPSDIMVSGLGNVITKVTLTLNGLTHSFPDDIDILLVAPGGANAFVFSDVGGGAPGVVVPADITLDDDAAMPLPNTGPPAGSLLVTGTYRPSNYTGQVGDTDSFPAPAPGGPYANPPFLSVFNGTNPNGTWSLFVVDDETGDSGSIAGGWSITITAVPEPSTWILLAGSFAAMIALGSCRGRRRL